MKAHPNVEIITESPGWGDYWVKIPAEYASGNAPDVVQFQANQIGEYCSRGVVAPIQPYIDNGTIDLTDWNMGFVDTGRYKGELYMITVGMTAQVMYCNKTLIESVGMKLWDETEDITWDEYEAFLNKLASKLPEGKYAGSDIGQNSDTVWTWVRQQTSTPGIEWVNEKGEFAPTLETMTNWYAFAERLRQSGAFPPVAWSVEDERTPWQEQGLATGKLAIRFENANKYKMLAGACEDELVLRRCPIASNGKRGTLLITSSFGISETSENKQLAAEYINFFVNNEEAQKIYNQEVGVTGSYKMQELLNNNKYDQKATELLNGVANDSDPFIPKDPGVWAIQNEIQNIAQAVSSGKMTSAEAAQFIIDQANDLISENR
jgi:ABC-type glycerol-3-phosphate transport system substrate-binding protein